MLRECIEALNIKPDGIYVDVTFGGGGHAKAILEKLDTGKLVAFDQDKDAAENAKILDHPNLVFVAANFRFLKNYLRFNRIKQVDGVLADLGISSHQIDEGSRGFSTRASAKLDMRMDQSGEKTAFDVINSYSGDQLRNIFRFYGEIKNAGRATDLILKARAVEEIEETGDLMEVLAPCAMRGKEAKYFAQVFQAIRIEVNDELTALQEMLEQSADVLKTDGRLVVMSYHSLEDRLVKNFMRAGNFKGEPEKDFYGNILRPFKPLKSKPISASTEEIGENRRARSAKLRIADKLAPQEPKTM